MTVLICMSNIFIGTSGWVYPDWQGKFYPSNLIQKKWLEVYAQNFQTVEINSTFYHSMRPTTFEKWAKAVPSNFIFAVKASRFITHIKRLKDPREPLSRFMEAVLSLDKKLGPALFQMPPRFKADEERLESFLSTVHGLQSTVVGRRKKTATQLHSRSVHGSSEAHSGSEIRLAFEFRDLSWFNESIYKILKKYNAALVITESGGYWPSSEVVTADFTYLRFHGEGGSYASKYTDGELNDWVAKIKKWQKAGIGVYAYFNNDVAAFAIENAKTLISLLYQQVALSQF